MASMRLQVERRKASGMMQNETKSESSKDD
jgi:hypothetical protein